MGIPLRLSTPTRFAYWLTGPKVAQWFQRDMKAVGINVKLEESEWITYMHTWAQGMPPTMAIDEMGWGMSIPSWTGMVTECDTLPPAGTNSGWYCNQKFDALLKAAIAEKDLDKAKEDYWAADRLIMEDAAYIPICNDEQPIIIATISLRVRNSLHRPLSCSVASGGTSLQGREPRQGSRKGTAGIGSRRPVASLWAAPGLMSIISGYAPAGKADFPTRHKDAPLQTAIDLGERWRHAFLCTAASTAALRIRVFRLRGRGHSRGAFGAKRLLATSRR